MNHKPTQQEQATRRSWAEYRAMQNIRLHIEKDKVIFWKVVAIGMTIACIIITYISTRQ